MRLNNKHTLLSYKLHPFGKVDGIRGACEASNEMERVINISDNSTLSGEN